VGILHEQRDARGLMNAHLWALLGGAAAAKESVMRALTGIEAEGYFDLMMTNGQILRMWTQIAGVNEGAEASTAEAWAKWWVDYSLEYGPHHRYNGLAVFDLSDRAKQAARNYLESFAAAGGVIESIVTIGATTPEWARDLGVPCASVAAGVPANAIAGTIRTMWGWR
jgi:hypothetical protein